MLTAPPCFKIRLGVLVRLFRRKEFGVGVLASPFFILRLDGTAGLRREGDGFTALLRSW